MPSTAIYHLFFTHNHLLRYWPAEEREGESREIHASNQRDPPACTGNGWLVVERFSLGHVVTMPSVCPQIREKAHQEQRQQEMEKQLLQQRVLQDQKFHAQQMEKEMKRAEEARAVQEFHHSQMKERLAGVLAEEKDESDYFNKNIELLQVEEEQFQEYAQQVIDEAKKRKVPIHPILAAARSGAGEFY